MRGPGPPQGTPCSGQGAHALLGLVACGPQGALPGAEPALGLPAEGLERCGELCQASWERPPAWGRIAGGPGPGDQDTPGLGLPGLGPAPLLPPPPTGRCRGREPEIMPARSGGLQAPQGAPGGHRRHRPRALAPAHGLAGLAARSEAPGGPRLVACQG